MKREILRRPQARTDLVDHFEYIGQQNSAAAERFIDAVEQGYARVLEFPRIGVEVVWRSPRLQGIRRWQVPGFQNFLIFYREVEDGVEIIRVLHGARDIGPGLLEADAADESVTIDPGTVP
jgi:toxin ParE1/3/4